MANQSNTLNGEPRTVQDIISIIEDKSADGGYIYRGERKCHTKVSSKLYRDYDDIEAEGFDIELIQRKILSDAKRHIGHLPQDFRADLTAFMNVAEDDADETINFDLLTEIQHYGGKTNLIDFTTDYFIALFFACDGLHHEAGRVILQKTEKIRNMINFPRNPRHRVIAQKSVFVRPPKGFIEPHEDEIVIIPAHLKKLILQHLRTYHGISAETIYNDLHGFIKNQEIHESANMLFYKGFADQNRADKATTFEAKQQEYEKAIEHYTKAIELKPNFLGAYGNRGNAYKSKGDYDRAIEEYNKVLELNPNHAIAYGNRGNAYKSKGDYDRAIEDHNKAIELKPDLAELYSNRGNAYGHKGEYDRSIEDHNKAIELKPDLAGAYNNRGDAYQKKGAVNRAIADYDKAIELKPDLAEPYIGRGEVWLQLEEWEKARADLTTAKDKGADIIALFKDDCGSLQDFEQQHGIQLPADIAEMLTPQ